MSIGKFVRTQYPPRHWALIGYAGDGKSTLSGNMKTPLGIVDSDDRYIEVLTRLGLSDEKALSIQTEIGEKNSPEGIASVLKTSKDVKLGTIVLDSLTGIMQPKIIEAMEKAKEKTARGGTKGGSAMVDKAMAMRTLIAALQNFGSDYLLIWHMENRRDNGGDQRVHQTLPQTERDALYRALNMILVTVKETKGGVTRYGVKVDWARNGNDGMVIWDEPGNFFKGMPEKIERAVYANGVKKDPVAESDQAPSFASAGDAIDWAVTQGVFSDRDASSAAYVKEKARLDPKTPTQMFVHWVSYVKGLKQAA